MRLRGWIDNIFLITSRAFEGVPGNWELRGAGGSFGSFRMNRFAFSEVTKSRSASDSFPSFFEMMVNCKMKKVQEQKNIRALHQLLASVMCFSNLT